MMLQRAIQQRRCLRISECFAYLTSDCVRNWKAQNHCLANTEPTTTGSIEMPKKKPRIGRPPTDKGTPPIRGQTRWHDDEWQEILAALEAANETYGAVVRRLMLQWARKPKRNPPSSLRRERGSE